MTRGPDREITATKVLEVFVISPDPAFVTSEIADATGYTKEGVRNRMNELAEEGLLAKKAPSSRIVIYWITPEGRQYYAENASTP